MLIETITPLKLAAIDIGSNAIRFQISSVLDQGPRILFKKLEIDHIRFFKNVLR